MVDRPKKPLHSSPAWCVGEFTGATYRGTGEVLTGMRVTQKTIALPVNCTLSWMMTQKNSKQAPLTPVHLPRLYSGTPNHCAVVELPAAG